MKKTIKRLELAYTGQFGADGTPLTLKDLREAVETFGNPPPVTIGHQMAREDWFPQFGQILSCELNEDENGIDGILVGDVEFNELAAEAYEAGLYTGWSISLPRRVPDNKRYIHHLALLGAVPPKIKDLKVLQEMGRVEADFAEVKISDEFFFTFSDQSPAGPDNDITTKEGTVGELEEAQAKIKKLEEENQGLRTQLKKTDEEFSDTKKTFRIYQAETKARKLEDLKAAAQGKVPAGLMDEFLDFADHVAESGSFEFSDGEKKVARPAIDVLIDVFKSIKSPELEKELDFSDPAGAREKEDLSGLTGCV